ncbi:hypothetical protein [Streptomyces sp. Ac-502]|uniref:hypothetical protein n=1 Tax=Streptomyces sp. Ac-502 TaxID=3342801 RepID=UPI00386245E1
MQSSHAPALAADPDNSEGSLYLAAVALDGQTYVTAHNGSAWNRPVKVGGVTDCAPALAVINSRLHCAVRGLDSRIWVASLGATWGSFEPVPHASSWSAPAITAGNGTAYVAYQST